MTIPLNAINLGTYEIRFIAEDYAGNQMILEGEELLTIEPPNFACDSGMECLSTGAPSTIIKFSFSRICWRDACKP